MPQLRIGLFGGSFDPIHKGHAQVAKAVCECLHLDRLYFIPNYKSIDNKILAKSADRLAMCHLVVKQDERWRLSKYEAEQKTAVFTYETIEYFHNKHPQATLYWIIGADRALDFANWHAADKILTLANLVIYQRNGIQLPKHITITHKQHPITLINSSTMQMQCGEILAMGLHHQMIPISSSQLRKSFMCDPETLTELLDPNVLHYIQQHQLYNTRENNHD